MSHKGIIAENNKKTHNFRLVGTRNQRQLMNKCSRRVNSCRIYILMAFHDGGKVFFFLNIVEGDDAMPLARHGSSRVSGRKYLFQLNMSIELTYCWGCKHTTLM